MIRCKKNEMVHHVVCPVLPADFPRVVTLCGSTRFKDAYIQASRDETLKGNIVLSVGLFGHQEGIDMDGPIKAMLDELHKRKIDLSDEILVLNVRRSYCQKCDKFVDVKYSGSVVIGPLGGQRPDCHLCVSCGSEDIRYKPYIGSSTRDEIEYALAHNKTVRYLNPPTQPPG